MATASLYSPLRGNLLLKNTNKSTQCSSNTMRASSKYGVNHGAHQYYSPHKTLFNHCSFIRGKKGCGLALSRPNPAKTKVSLGRTSLQLSAFSGRKPLSIDRELGNGDKGFKRCNHVCSGNDSASVNASVSLSEQRDCLNSEEEELPDRVLKGWTPPRYVWRALSAWVIAGQVIARVMRGRLHVRNCLQQLEVVGPGSIGVCLLTAAFVGMAFTIQFVREFTKLGLTRSVGGVLALALSRELSPVVTSIIIAGRVGSAFAAELGTMQVSEQTDTLRVLGTDPVDYLVIPRVFACCVALPVLTLICFTVAMAASVLIADGVYNVSANIILDSARRALEPWDIVSAMIKSMVFGGFISVVSCAWGVTTLGGAKGVGESTTSAVVISLVCVFIADFVLSWLFFQGAGDALKAAMG
ncbi:hypothetical protein SUGI_0630780 [Cryptomeria japonica]|uniref:protein TRIGALACTOSYLDIACYLGLYCEROL 1, chloroplastic n=1 Tax=Cryptomeria japonica TaxID=3369 RepID=UPI002414A624|nr:protein TRIGALACTOSYLDIACYLGLYCEROL 1, chloroplastic [Cryptomeria japonica]GLJ31430.1 hypothetical protein SUGI_0630780 [Cryptomeria japonica]